jgi:hypothetical protein
MVNEQRSEIKRHYSGEPAGTNLSNWLNSIHGGKEKEFVLGLLKVAREAEIAGRTSAVCKYLARVELNPALEFEPEMGFWKSWNVAEDSTLRNRKTEIESWWKPFGTGDAIIATLDLLQQRLVDRIRQCDCGSWFHARFAHSRYCSSQCQQVYGSKTDAFKARRRNYMRDYLRARKKADRAKHSS